MPVWCCNNVSLQDSKPPPFAGVMFANKNAVNVGTTVYEVITSYTKWSKQNHRQIKHATILFGRYKVLSWNKLHFSCQNSRKNNISFYHTYSSCVEGCSTLGFQCSYIFFKKSPLLAHSKDSTTIMHFLIVILCHSWSSLMEHFTAQLQPINCHFLFQSSCCLSLLTEAFCRHGGDKVWTQV